MIKQGLSSKLKRIFGKGIETDQFYEDLEDILIEADLGALTAVALVKELRIQAKQDKLKDRKDLQERLKQILKGWLKYREIELERDKLNLILVLGVNGVGKTTTIAKLAHYFREQQGIEEILLSAGDTFRAGAIEQLQHHGRKLGLKVVRQQPGSDPAAVIFDTIDSAKTKGTGLIIADTAGRMHNKSHLVAQLEKIDRIIRKKLEGGLYQTLLVIDATTGQNGFKQAQLFHEAIGINSIALTKYDSTAKGGIAVNICKTLALPISFLGVGEGLEDLKPFNPDDYLSDLLGRE